MNYFVNDDARVIPGPMGMPARLPKDSDFHDEHAEQRVLANPPTKRNREPLLSHGWVVKELQDDADDEQG